ncbi:hypothetical protein JCM3774_001746 [Rhodotorula dairenensis]
MDIDTVDDARSPTPTKRATRASKRVAELEQVEENIAALLHFAGCTLASLHPDPLSNFTVREIATEADDGGEDDEGSDSPTTSQPKVDQSTPRRDDDQDEREAKKLAEFAKYAEGYYATLNDVQLALRTSIRHLRVSRVSGRALTDPQFGSVRNQHQHPSGSSSSAEAVGPGGVAFEAANARAGGGGGAGVGEWDMRASRLPRSEAPRPQAPSTCSGASVAALELERDALRDLVAALDPRRPRTEEDAAQRDARVYVL